MWNFTLLVRTPPLKSVKPINALSCWTHTTRMELGPQEGYPCLLISAALSFRFCDNFQSRKLLYHHKWKINDRRGETTEGSDISKISSVCQSSRAGILSQEGGMGKFAHPWVKYIKLSGFIFKVTKDLQFNWTKVKHFFGTPFNPMSSWCNCNQTPPPFTLAKFLIPSLIGLTV